jgi:molecular chaperone GrpE
VNSKEKNDAEKERDEKKAENVKEKGKHHEHKEDWHKKYSEAEKELETVKKALEEKTKESDDYLDKYRRTLADMENLRKRTTQEKQDSLKYSNFNIVSDLSLLLDDFQRAIDAAKKEQNMDPKNFVEGVEMIEKQFIDLLHKKYGVEKYGEKGDLFDPKIHMALTMEKGDFEHEIILEVFRKGYMLHDRVIRAAEVKIGRPNEEPKAENIINEFPEANTEEKKE